MHGIQLRCFDKLYKIYITLVTRVQVSGWKVWYEVDGRQASRVRHCRY